MSINRIVTRWGLNMKRRSLSVQDRLSHTHHVLLRRLNGGVYCIRTAEGQFLAHALLDVVEKILQKMSRSDQVPKEMINSKLK